MDNDIPSRIHELVRLHNEIQQQSAKAEQSNFNQVICQYIGIGGTILSILGALTKTVGGFSAGVLFAISIICLIRWFILRSDNNSRVLRQIEIEDQLRSGGYLVDFNGRPRKIDLPQ